MDTTTPPRLSKPKNATSTGTGTPPEGATNYKQNPEIDARIDTYIKENPKHWAHIQGMSRDRLERTVVLGEVRQQERQQRMREGMLKRIEQNPGLKQAYETLVKDLPEDQREGVMIQLARTQQRVTSRTQGPSTRV